MQRGNSFIDVEIFQNMEHAVLNESILLHTAEKIIQNKTCGIVWHCGNFISPIPGLSYAYLVPPESERI